MSDVAAGPHSFVCRCEEIGEAELREAIVAGARTINDLKRRTRAGMGLCQGMFCLEHMAAIISEQTGVDPDHVAPMTSRPPARQVTLGALAGERGNPH